MSKKITLTKNNVPKYFKWDDKVHRVDEKTYIEIFKHHLGFDISTHDIRNLSHYMDEEVEIITKSEFVAYCNKAYKAITGFKHVEDLWVDEEGDAHE